MINGVVTAASLLVNGPAAEHAVGMMKTNGLLDSMGLHLNLTEGTPVGNPEGIPTLLSPHSPLSADRLFLGKTLFQAAHINPAEAALEARAQAFMHSVVGRQAVLIWFLAGASFY